MEENEKRDINMVAMEVIMNAGDGRDKIDEALAAMAEGKLDEVDKLLEEAEALIVKAHNAQTEVIQSQVSGESMEYSLLFVMRRIRSWRQAASAVCMSTPRISRF